jgi:hypothetical protein
LAQLSQRIGHCAYGEGRSERGGEGGRCIYAVHLLLHTTFWDTRKRACRSYQLLTAQGKLDRRQLPVPQQTRHCPSRDEEKNPAPKWKIIRKFLTLIPLRQLRRSEAKTRLHLHEEPLRRAVVLQRELGRSVASHSLERHACSRPAVQPLPRCRSL